MKIQFLQHVSAEGPGSLLTIFEARGGQCAVHELYLGGDLPAPDSFDWLVVMGGPMGVDDVSEYPWLVEEKQLIRTAIMENKIVMGICLGAQLIADVLDAKVRRNAHREIGWFPIRKNSEIEHSVLGKVLPQSARVFHWHGDTFDIPDGALAMAGSEACQNQGFVLENRVFAFQFHPEITIELAREFIDFGYAELDGSRYVQSADEIINEKQGFSDSVNLVEAIVDAVYSVAKPQS